MTLQDIQYVAEIAESGSITKAATKLFVAQPALSHCLQKVENEIGRAIFARASSGVTLTESGACFMEFAHVVLQANEAMKLRLIDLNNVVSGTVRIGFTGLLMTNLLPKFFSEYRKRYPDVEVFLTQGRSEDIENEIIKGNLDVAILHPPFTSSKVDCFIFDHDEMVVIPRSTSDYQPYLYSRDKDNRTYIDLAFLKTEPLVLPVSINRSRMTCDRILQNAGISPVILQTTDFLAACATIAEIDYATTILPEKQLPLSLREKGFYYIAPEYSPEYPLYVVVSNTTYLNNATRRLLDLLLSISKSEE